MIIHRASGYKLLLRMLAATLGPQRLRGFPAARTAADKRDEALLPFLGEPHDAALGSARCGPQPSSPPTPAPPPYSHVRTPPPTRPSLDPIRSHPTPSTHPLYCR